MISRRLANTDFTCLVCHQNAIWQSRLKQRRAAIKSCVCWTGHCPQAVLVIPLSSCQQLLSREICHLDCLCYFAIKIRMAYINIILISKCMLIWLIWSQMTLLDRRGSSEPFVEKTPRGRSTYQNRCSTRAFRFIADSPPLCASNENCSTLFWRVGVSGVMAADLRYQPHPLLSCQALHGWRVGKTRFMKTCTTVSWHLHGRIRTPLKVKDRHLN